MNVLIVTPMYYIKDRADLKHDSSAIHYLVRPWAKEHRVFVIYIYLQSVKNITRYLSHNARRFRDGYLYEVDGVKVALIEVQTVPKQGPYILSFQQNRIIKFIQLFCENNRFSPDVIVSHIPTTNVGVVSDIFKDVKKIAILHNTDRLYWGKKAKNTELIRKSFDVFYSRSTVIRDFFFEKGLSKLSNEIIYSGTQSVVSKRVVVPKDEISIAYVGKLEKLKNVDVIIDAVSVLQKNYSCSLNIVGEGKQKKKLEKVAKSKLRKGSYTFWGYVNHDEAIKIMSNSDMFVMVSSPETFGLVYLEAMGKGCVTVGSLGEGIDGVIIDGVNGLLVKPGNVNDLFCAIERYIKMDNREKQLLVDNAIKTAKRFNEINMGLKYLKLIKDITY